MKGWIVAMETSLFLRNMSSISLILLIALIQTHGYKACLDTERLALLELKSFFVSASDTDYADEVLTSWVDDDPNCCDWERVKCSATTRRVIQLSLNETMIVNTLGLLNLTLFHPLEELQSLDLSYNGFEGVNDEDKQAIDSFGSLKQLKFLNMSLNRFNDSILPYLNSLTSLTTLILSQNQIELFNPKRRFTNLRNLQVLDLSDNPITNGFAKGLGLSNLTNLKSLLISYCSLTTIQGIVNLRNLQVLDLSRNPEINGSIIDLSKLSARSEQLCYQGLANWTDLKTLKISDCGITTLQGFAKLKSLRVLDLSDNEINDSLESKGLDKLKNLQVLDLSCNQVKGTLEGICGWKNLIELDLRDNNFEGHLPQCLANLTRLEVLDVSSNKLRGDLTSIAAITASIKYLDLLNNNFEGVFPLSLLANHSNLKVFCLSTGNNMFKVTTENWIPTFQLKFIWLANCNLNVIPSFLLNQYDIKFLDLSHNKMVGNFPSWLLKNNTKLESLWLTNNSFTGVLQVPNTQHVLQRLDISRNNFIGKLPRNIGIMFRKMKIMNLSTNNFEGNIPSSIGEMKEVGLFDFSRNNFSGQLPTPFLKGCVRLWLLDLSYNNFHGQIFSKQMNFPHLLQFLYLENNNFSGKIGEVLRIDNLKVLDISNNMFSGHIPRWMGNFSSYFRIILMSKNHLEGNIPTNILKVFEILDISENNLSGSLSFPSNSALMHLYLQKNSLSGLIPGALFRSSKLMTLDLRDNNFSGRIPRKINELSDLRVLLLRGNYLRGHIPNQLCQLRKLGILDLSRNKLNGSIPSCFSNVPLWRVGDNTLYQGELEFSSSHGATFDAPINFKIANLHLYGEIYILLDQHVEVELMRNNRYEFYNGSNLDYLTGLDLSCNQLTGEIPSEIGQLQKIQVLNLSHNLLGGSIPESFSKLKMTESLDLSYNKLSGRIPPQLIDLNYLSNFNVSYNNLSGPIPDKEQFGTFDESSYRGNLDLCGSLIKKKCSSVLTPTAQPVGGEIEEDESVIDMVALKWSFGASYVTVILGIFAVLWINSYWRRQWFYFIDRCIDTCYYWIYKYVFYR